MKADSEIIEIPEFVNREKEKKSLKAVLSGRPNLVYFVYGPINSGKTALINEVIKELSENYRVFYINFRGFEGGYQKFTRVMFKVGDEGLWKKLCEKLDIISAGVEYVEKLAKKINTGIVLPAEFIRRLQVGDTQEDKVDVFNYLEEVMKRFNEKGFKPVLIFDELQVIREEINATGMPLLARLFNFFVRMTKETHLCHCLCATSDCLFIEEIFSNARLDGRAKYLLVDDMEKDEAFEVYEAFGFEDKELIWDYIGGKTGDVIGLFEEKKQGFSEKEALERLLLNEIARLRWIEARLFNERKDAEKLWEFLKEFKEGEKSVSFRENFDKLVYWIKENVLFYNPLTGNVRPQSRLLWHAIKRVVN